MVEYVAIILGLAVVIFALLDFILGFDLPDPLDTKIIVYFKIGLYLVVLVLCLIVIGFIAEIMRLQTFSSASTQVILGLYGFWIWLIVIIGFFLVLYTMFILPAQVKAIMEKRKKIEEESEGY